MWPEDERLEVQERKGRHTRIHSRGHTGSMKEAADLQNRFRWSFMQMHLAKARIMHTPTRFQIRLQVFR